MLRSLINIFFPQTYRTPAELPPEEWRGYIHTMQIATSTRKALVTR